MDGQNTSQQPTQQQVSPQPTISSAPAPRSNMLVIVLVGLVMLGVGIGGGYLLFSNNKEQTSPVNNQQVTQISPTQEVQTMGPKLTTDYPTKVITQPINQVQFEKTIVSTDNCNNPLGLVTYRDKKTNRVMNINSTLNSQFEQSKKALSEIENFLQGGNLTAYQNLNSWAFPFHWGCGGASEIFIKELTGIIFPNVDKTRTAIFYTTQSATGEVSVYVFAQKGSDIIRLSKFLYEDTSLYTVSRSACKNDQSKTEECYKEKLKEDTVLHAAAVKEAKELITLFAVK